MKWSTTCARSRAPNCGRCWLQICPSEAMKQQQLPSPTPSAGAFAVVLELVTPRVAKNLTQRAPIPTIGIGAGGDCDGQILVTSDLLGMLPWYDLKHVKPRLNAAEQMRTVVKEWKKSVET